MSTDRKYKADPGIGRDDAPIGSEAWAQAVRLHLQVIVKDIDSEPKRVGRYIDIIAKHHAWTLMNKPDGSYFKTWEEFCEFRQPWGLGKSWEDIKPYLVAAAGGNTAVVEAMATRPEAAPTKSDAASKAGKVGGRGRPKKQQPADNNKVANYGTDPAYLAARIARDAPAVHEDMKAGKYPSVRAAAKAAGIVKDPNPVRVAATALAKVPTHRLAELVALVDVDRLKMIVTCARDRGAA